MFSFHEASQVTCGEEGRGEGEREERGRERGRERERERGREGGEREGGGGGEREGEREGGGERERGKKEEVKLSSHKIQPQRHRSATHSWKPFHPLPYCRAALTSICGQVGARGQSPSCEAAGENGSRPKTEWKKEKR